MAAIRRNLVYAAIDRAYALINSNDPEERYELQKQMILDDESLTKDEQTYAIKRFTKDYDHYKVLYNKGTKRFCDKCQQECLATLYCEHCVRIYLRNNFSNCTSGNNDIDDLIQKCQIESFIPNKIIEWIPYNRLQNIEYLTKGGCSEIYSAKWIDGPYEEWDSRKQRLKRCGLHRVILKQLENVKSADRSWFDEAKSHLIMGNKFPPIVKCYGLTQNPSNGNYMLVMRLMKTNLRKYLQQHQITWKEKIYIAYKIIRALDTIHQEKAIHRDLHSGNILLRGHWRISDFGFCGPADKPLKSIYGNLPYIAPEVIVGKNYTFASDVYSIGILMWEISSGKPPFGNYEHNYDLAMRIVNGMRPKIIPAGTPSEYEKLMIQCWDANPLNRSDSRTLCKKIEKMWRDSYKDTNEFNTLEYTTSTSSSSLTNLNSSSKLYSLSTSSLYQFENLPEPRNATEEEQEAFHSNPCDFSIPDNIESLYSKGQDNVEISEDFSEGLKGLNLNKDDSMIEFREFSRSNLDR